MSQTIKTNIVGVWSKPEGQSRVTLSPVDDTNTIVGTFYLDADVALDLAARIVAMVSLIDNPVDLKELGT